MPISHNQQHEKGKKCEMTRTHDLKYAKETYMYDINPKESHW